MAFFHVGDHKIAIVLQLRYRFSQNKINYKIINLTIEPLNHSFLKGSYDAISIVPFSLEHYKLLVHKEDL